MKTIERTDDELHVVRRYVVGPTLRVAEARRRTEKIGDHIHSIDGHTHFVENKSDTPEKIKGNYWLLTDADGRKTVTLVTPRSRWELLNCKPID